MLLRIAWKNVWRSKRRSAIMVAAIAIGLWGGLFAVGASSGIYDSVVSSSIDRSLAHIQIHAPGYQEDRLVTTFIPHADSLIRVVRAVPGVRSVSGRTLIDGMGASPSSSQGVRIVGIDPAAEGVTTAIGSHLVQGSYFGGTEQNQVVIGRKLAERLSVKLRSKIVLSFQGPDDVIVYGAFRIGGVYDTNAASFDGSTVFVRQSDLAGLMGATLVHEIAVRINSNDSLASETARIAALCPGLRVQDWKSIAPELRFVESADTMLVIILGIILLALMFGITNTMLMSVMDRVREFGVLMAIGMQRRRVFVMIACETLFLSVTGAAIGGVLGFATVAWTAHTGIDLAWFSDGLAQYGMSSMLVPNVHGFMYLSLGVMVIVTAGLAAIYPAMKAIRLNPATALASIG